MRRKVYENVFANSGKRESPCPQGEEQMVEMIEVEDLHKRFGTIHAVNGVSLQVKRGEVLGFLGPNGAGKSTLLRCLAGLIPLSGGDVEILGETFSGNPSLRQRKALRRQLGFVFQFHGLVRRTSALSNVVNGYLGQGHGIRAWHQMLAPHTVRPEARAALEAVRPREN